jgi:hypothetical protein
MQEIYNSIEKELRLIEDQIKEIEAINKSNRKIRHDSKIANVITLVALIISVTLTSIMLR